MQTPTQKSVYIYAKHGWYGWYEQLYYLIMLIVYIPAYAIGIWYRLV